MDSTNTIRPGDEIMNASGISYIVSEVLYQDYYGDPEKAAPGSDWYGYDVEFKDNRGRYHHWKQNQDGGKLIRYGRYTETWRDFYGSTAMLTKHVGRGEQYWSLIVYTSNGVYVHGRSYGTWRGARIAMGRIGDAWKQIAHS